MNEDKASRYHRLARRARTAEVAWSAGLMALVVFSPLSAAMRDAATALAGRSGLPGPAAPTAVVLLYVVMLAALHECGALPLAYYRGHALERRYGLSAETGRHWARTRVKAGAVGLCVAGVGAGVLYLAIGEWPEGWWVAVTLGVPLVTVLLAWAGPVLILPVFYTFTPVDRDALGRRLEALSRRAGVPVLGVYAWKLSDSTRKANAAFVGMGRTRRVLVSDTLLADYSDEEVEVVLAHELAHYVHGDVWRALAFEALVVGAGAYLARGVLAAAGPAVGLTGPADVAGLPLVLLALGAVSVAAVPAANARSRAHERRADRFALRLTGHRAAFDSAMRRLARQNLAEERPSWLARTLFYSHPPIGERLQLARDAAGGQTPPSARPPRPAVSVGSKLAR